MPRIAKLLQEQGAEDVVLTVGGTIPQDDIPELKELGVAEIFTPGSSVQEIIDFIEGAVPAWQLSQPSGLDPDESARAASAARGSSKTSAQV